MSSPDHAHETDDEAAARAVESLDLRDAMIAGLASGVNDLTEVARKLYQAAILTRLQPYILGALVAMTTLCVVLLFQLQGIATVNRSNNQATRDNTAVIKDCTEPTGKCFEQAQARTAALVAQLNLAALIAAECADAYDGQAAITACYTRRLKEQNP